MIFKDGFESGNFAAWTSSSTAGGNLTVTTTAALSGTYGVRANVITTTAMYVQDDTPNAETRYRARFSFDPNSIPMAAANAHYLFYGYSGASTVVLRIEFQCATAACPTSGAYQIRANIVNTGTTWVNTAWYTITDAPHVIEFDWKRASTSNGTDGYLTLWIDGTQRENKTGIGNGNRLIDKVQLGMVGGRDTGTSGA